MYAGRGLHGCLAPWPVKATASRPSVMHAHTHCKHLVIGIIMYVHSQLFAPTELVLSYTSSYIFQMLTTPFLYTDAEADSGTMCVATNCMLREGMGCMHDRD